MNTQVLTLPFGTFQLTADETALTGFFRCDAPEPEHPNEITRRAASTVLAYLAGGPLDELPLRPAGTAFEQAVWRQLMTIPYGQTRSYSDIAAALRRPTAVRAVGHAIGKNPILLFVPCHRVIGKDGSLTGYAAGLAMKRFLLDLEQR